MAKQKKKQNPTEDEGDILDAHEIALQMLSEKADLEFIVQVTGLNPAEIQQLAQLENP